MAKNAKKMTKPTRRTQVKELPKEEKQLSKDEQKKVKGGASMIPGIGTAVGAAERR